MAFNTTQVVLDGFTQHEFAFTMFASGGLTAADVGKAVSLDTTADATVKLAADGEAIYGRIFQVENRTQEGVVTVTVETRFRKRLPKATGTVIARGATIVGAGGGLVKAAGVTDTAKNVALTTGSGLDYVIVEQ